MISLPYKTYGGTSFIPAESRFLLSGKIFLFGEITSEMACEFIIKLISLRDEKSLNRIRIYINSPGGEFSAGMMIYDALKGLNADYEIYCIGLAASMAAIILAGGQKGRRYILPHSRIMIHEPLVLGGIGGSATAIQRTAESILETKRTTMELLATDTGRDMEEIQKAISFDHYMDAREAVEFGICDEIFREIR